MPSDHLIDCLLKDASKRVRGQYGPFKLPVVLHPKQQLFVDCTAEESLFGGSAGGGKSYAALASALQFAHVPGFSGLVLRRRLTDLALPGGLLDVSHRWLTKTKAHYQGDLRMPIAVRCSAETQSRHHRLGSDS